MNYDDFDLEIYAWHMISKLNTYLKEDPILLNELHDKMDYFDDKEFSEFINHEKSNTNENDNIENNLSFCVFFRDKNTEN